MLSRPTYSSPILPSSFPNARLSLEIHSGASHKPSQLAEAVPPSGWRQSLGLYPESSACVTLGKSLFITISHLPSVRWETLTARDYPQ
jgi:hypothetical protein